MRRTTEAGLGGKEPRIAAIAMAHETLRCAVRYGGWDSTGRQAGDPIVARTML